MMKHGCQIILCFQIFSQRPIQKEATLLCTSLLQAFSSCLEQLAFSPPLNKHAESNKWAMSQPEEFKMALVQTWTIKAWTPLMCQVLLYILKLELVLLF